jgi:hypothetical protein
MEDNNDLNIPKWAKSNYPRTSMYDDAQVNVLEEALPLQTNHKSKGIRKVIRNPKHMNYNYMHIARLAQILFKLVLSIKLEYMIT